MTLVQFMYDLLTTILGDYQPIMTTIEYELADGSIHSYQAVASGIAGINVQYILAFALFIYLFEKILSYINAGVLYIGGYKVKKL